MRKIALKQLKIRINKTSFHTVGVVARPRETFDYQLSSRPGVTVR